MNQNTCPQSRVPVRNSNTPSSRVQPQDARQSTTGSKSPGPRPSSASQWWRPLPSSAQNSDVGRVNANAATFTGRGFSAAQPTAAQRTLQLDPYCFNSVSLMRRNASPARVQNNSVIPNRRIRAPIGQIARAPNTSAPCAAAPSEMSRALVMMKDATDVNFAFVFNLSGSGRLVALWANHTVLTKASDQFQKLHRFNVPDWRNVTPSLWLHSVFVAWVLGDPLVPYCAMIRYLYTGQLELEVDMRQFLITEWPIQALAELREKKVKLNEVWAGPVRTFSLSELCELAERYQLRGLVAACKRLV